MEKFIVQGEKKLTGSTSVSGAKNVALKALVAACMTDEEVIIENVPLISDFFVMVEIIKHLGGSVRINDHTAIVKMKEFKRTKISLDQAAEVRTSVLFLAPLLARTERAEIPNPGGCRIGARPIDRTVDGLQNMNISIYYDSKDGYFHAKTDRIMGTNYRFEKNTHTGTETLILAAVLASGKTTLENAAQEPEVDELISFLNLMGADIRRTSSRTIVINGVKRLHSARFTIGPDRNEIITIAIASYITKGDIFIEGAEKVDLLAFLTAIENAGLSYEKKKDGIRFFANGAIHKTNVATSQHPGFMTDWQAPWAVLMTQAEGISTIHETVYEQRFGYVSQLHKMGAKITFFEPEVKDPKNLYNFNLSDDIKENMHAIKIEGAQKLHNAVVTISDLRAGATLVLAALAAKGDSSIFGVELLDRGYERFDERLKRLGAKIKRVKV